MRFIKKQVLLIMLLILVITVVGCSNNGSKLNQYNLRVNISDTKGNSVMASVDLKQDGELIDNKNGSVVEFVVSNGTYELIAREENNADNIIKKQVVISKKDEVLTLQLADLNNEGSVSKIIFSETMDKNFTIKDLEEGESAIIGIATLEFDSNDISDWNITVNPIDGLTANTSGEFVGKPQVNNPKYNYSKPKLNNRDLLKKDIDFRNTLNLQNISNEIPEFESKSYNLEDDETFNIVNKENNFDMIETKVKGIGEYCYIFIDNELLDSITEENINKYIEEFDKNIYENNTSFYNNLFDIDGNSMLKIVFYNGTNDYGGYFHSIDFTDHQYSNKGDIIYVNGDYVEEDFENLHFERDDWFLSVISHEFQHLLWFYRGLENGWGRIKENPTTDRWIDEGMATYAEQLNGYMDVCLFIIDYFAEYTQEGIGTKETSEVSLLAWDHNTNDYGISNLFTNYIIEQFDEGIIGNIYDESINPYNTIENYAKMDFESIFMNFIIANKLYVLDLPEKEYRYDYSLEILEDGFSYGEPVHTELVKSTTTRFKTSSAVKYYKINGSGNDITIDLDGVKINESKIGAFVYRYYE